MLQGCGNAGASFGMQRDELKRVQSRIWLGCLKKNIHDGVSGVIINIVKRVNC